MVLHLHPLSTHDKALEGIILISTTSEIKKLTEEDVAYLKAKLVKDSLAFLKSSTSLWITLKAQINLTESYINLEKVRQASSEAYDLISKEECKELHVFDFQESSLITLAFLEALLLSAYSFQKYKSEQKDIHLKAVHFYTSNVSKGELAETQAVSQAVCTARDWVNEPLITFTAEDFGRYASELGKAKGFNVQVYDKKKIERLKMGGLLAINAGSPNHPTFIVAKHKPANAINKKPIVLIGKGVVYDTGGLSLKPTPNSMDYMKCDMAGGAAVIATLSAVAENKLPLYIIAMVPATENRPDGNAITPGDVITMFNGKTVEIMNTDAEGRIILADALSYAQQYEPELVIDVATLTGSAVMSIGNKGIVYMGTAARQTKNLLESVGCQVYERLVEFPLWEEYGKYLDSDIADMKNLGGADSGAITAGKFLEKFTAYPWLHLDIAAMAYLHHKDSYRPKGGTGVTVRLLYQFLKNQTLSDGKPST